MGHVLLVDFGSSRIKAALCDADFQLLDEEETSGIRPIELQNGRRETNPEDYWQALEHCVSRLLSRHPGSSPDCLSLCSEMHGFLLADIEGKPLTPYIGWQDQRAAYPHEGRPYSPWEAMKPYAARFRELTGMRLRPGLPWLNVAACAQNGTLPATCRLLTLPDWILVRGGCHTPHADPTMAAGTGFFDIHTMSWSDELAQTALEDTETNLEFVPLATANTRLGQIRLAGRTMPVYGGTGDLQTALYGAGFGPKRQTMLNLGTGSQAAVVGGDEPNASFEVRLTCDQKICRCITHIPGGKALAMVAEIFDGCSQAGGGTPFFWKMWQELSPDEIISATPTADLNMFEAAWHYTEQSGTILLREQWTAPRKLLAGIALSWCQQYAEALRELHADDTPAFLCGGLSRRSPFASLVLTRLTGRLFSGNTPAALDETLDGLVRILNNAK